MPEDDGNGVSLDEVLQAEAEALATELEQAEAEGLEPQMLDEVEGTVESAAEALMTMREARHKLQEVRKDRGFGKASSAPSSPQSARPGFKKRGVCHDCGLPGHWAGDQGCLKPGAGLARPKSSPKPAATTGSSLPRRVHLTETFAAEATPQEPEQPTSFHEAAVVTTVGSFAEALEASQPHEVQSVMAVDKRLVGALDSACNRTVCGRFWLDGYLQALSRSPLWQALQPLVKTEAERENFKFGNDGVKASYSRHRLPMLVGQSCVLVWTSVVEVESLGLLLGRDFLEAVGGVISFTRRALRADHLDGSRIPLRQLSAGHFFLDVFPRTWSSTTRPWRREGQDGLLDVQLSGAEWSLRRAAAVKGVPMKGREHEQLAVEPASGSHDGRSGSRVLNSMTQPVTPVLSQSADGLWQGRASDCKVPSHVPAPPRKKRVALRWASALVAAATVAALRAPAVQQHSVPIGLEGASRGHGPQRGFVPTALSCGCSPEQVRGPGVAQGRGLPEGPVGDPAGFLGGPNVGRNAGSSPHKRGSSRYPQPAGGQAEGRGGRKEFSRGAADGCSGLVGPQRWPPDAKAGPSSAGHVAACGSECARHGGEDQAKGAANPRRTPGNPSSSGPTDYNDGGAGGIFGWTTSSTPSPSRPTSARGRAQDRRADAATDPNAGRTDATGECHDGCARQSPGGHAPPNHAACDDNGGGWLGRPPAGWGSSPVTGQRHGLPASVRQRAVIPPLRQQLKAGQRLVIAQAWNKCRHDRKLVKVSPQELNEALYVLQEKVYDDALNEPFLCLDYVPRPGDRSSLVPTVCQLAVQRGHTVAPSRVSSGSRPFFLMLRASGRSPLLNYSPRSTRLAAERKLLGAEAAVMQSALAHRRSGRHFFMELLRGADPYRTLEGQELMDEVGLFDLSRNGRRYLTSSQAVADVLRQASAENLEGAMLDAMQRQFDEDHGPEKVTEAFAAETGADEDEFLEGLGGTLESEVGG